MKAGMVFLLMVLMAVAVGAITPPADISRLSGTAQTGTATKDTIAPTSGGSTLRMLSLSSATANGPSIWFGNRISNIDRYYFGIKGGLVSATDSSSGYLSFMFRPTTTSQFLVEAMRIAQTGQARFWYQVTFDSTIQGTITNALLADSTSGGAARAEVADSTIGGAARAAVSDSATKIDTTYVPFQEYVTNHAGVGAGDIDAVTADYGLNGGAVSGNATLSVDSAEIATLGHADAGRDTALARIRDSASAIIGPFIDSTQLDTIQNAHKAVLADSTTGAARAQVADSAAKIDTTYVPFQGYVANHAGGGGGITLGDVNAYIDSTQLDTIQYAHKAVLSDSTNGGAARAELSDSTTGGAARAELADSTTGGAARAELADSTTGGAARAELADSTLRVDTSYAPLVSLANKRRDSALADIRDTVNALDTLTAPTVITDTIRTKQIDAYTMRTDTLAPRTTDTLNIEGGAGNVIIRDTLDMVDNNIIGVNKIVGDSADFDTYINAPSLTGDTITANVAKVNWIFPKDSAMVVIGDTGAATVWVFDSDTIRFNTTELKNWAWGAININFDLWDSLWNNVGNFRTGTGGSGSGDTTIFNDGTTEFSTVNNRIKVKEGANIDLIRQDSTNYDVITIGVTGSVPLSDSTSGGAARAELSDSTTGGAARAELADSATGAARAQVADSARIAGAVDWGDVTNKPTIIDSTTGGDGLLETANDLDILTGFGTLVRGDSLHADFSELDDSLARASTIRDTIKAVLYNTEYVNLSASMIYWTAEPMKAVAKFLTWPWIDTTTTYTYPDSLFAHAYLYRAYDTTANNDSLFTVIRWQADKACSLLSVIWCGTTSSATASTSSLDSTILYINTTKREGLASQLASTALDTITVGLTGNAALAINAGDLVTVIFRHVIGNDAYADCKWATITRKPR